jgi:glycolate oxidase FAD binding subunit
MVNAESLAGLRPGTEADAIDGVTPRQVLAPRAPEELAGALAHASAQRWSTVIRGGGTKLGWGRIASAIDLVISTASINQLVAHRHGDMTATVQSGASLADVNRALAQHGQWLPLDSAFDGATIGGLVATNDAGPARHRNGTPRDLVIGMTVAMTDGRLIKSGGTVVKNVAGYDLGKLMSGSFGSLTAIVDVTFKLLPRPAASITLVASYQDAATLAADVAALTASQLEPFALDVRADLAAAGGELLICYASSPQATEAQVAATRALLRGRTTLAPGPEQHALWTDHIRAPWTGGFASGETRAPSAPPSATSLDAGRVVPPAHAPAMDPPAVIRLSWMPATLAQVLAELREVARAAAVPLTISGRAGLGTGLITLGGDAAAQAAAIATLRASREVGHVAVLRASRALKQLVDVWGPPHPSAPMGRAFKQMFDPAHILGAGRGPV